MLVNLTPAVLDLKLYAGDETAVIIHVVNKATKAPLDISDRTWTSQWRRKRDSTTAVTLFVDESGAANGDLVVHFPDNLEPQGVWDLQGNHAVNGDDTILQGVVSVELDVTRP